MTSNKKVNQSRRNFIKGVGTGIVGAYATSSKLDAKTLPKEINDSIEGKVKLSLTVNGSEVKRNIKSETTLAEFLREELGLTGTKIVCNQGECGGCTVLVNGRAVYSCHMLALDADNSEVLTIEGLLENKNLSKLQESFVAEDGLQCGFCTPGQIISAYALLNENQNPTDEEIKIGMSGNLCRCAAYPKIFDSVKAAIDK